jgi:hypothetical protein
VSKICSLEVGRTGLKEAEAAAVGFEALSVVVEYRPAPPTLSYAPPFSPRWDPVLIAAPKAWQRVEGDAADSGGSVR